MKFRGDELLNEILDVVPSTGSMYNIDSSRVINIDRQLLQLVWCISRKSRKGKRCSGPQGCIHLCLACRIAVAMKALGISSHDIDGSGARGSGQPGPFAVVPGYCCGFLESQDALALRAAAPIL